MTRRALALAMLVLLPGLVAAAPPPAAPASGPPSAAPSAPPARQWEGFKILSERNMFLRNRSRPPSMRRTPTVFVAASSNAGRVVLTGIVQQEDDYIAFFENTLTGKTTQVQVDDPLGKGYVTAITIDAVEYTCGDEATVIAIGCDLTGTAAALSRPTTAAASAPAATAATPSAPTPGTANGTMGVAPASPFALPTPANGSIGVAPPWPFPPPMPADGAIGITAPSPFAAPAAPPTSTTPPQSAPPPTAVGAPGATKDSGAAGVLERMRQRREQELNR